MYHALCTWCAVALLLAHLLACVLASILACNPLGWQPITKPLVFGVGVEGIMHFVLSMSPRGCLYFCMLAFMLACSPSLKPKPYVLGSRFWERIMYCVADVQPRCYLQTCCTQYPPVGSCYRPMCCLFWSSSNAGSLNACLHTPCAHA